ncbi:hypothetical protein [Streptomyces sp. NBC_01601]|uniref:hypothetical protein n=1 Tax=Streptomyces sp. NBC_01601 TaxID=2975892 RepID=UPI002E2805CB|nr:hypothetical protein [Streptomyces sp. NBC_01601]
MPDPGTREEPIARELGPYGRLEISAITDPRCGNVLYRLYAPHVRGCVMFSPAASSDDLTRNELKPGELLIHPDAFVPAFSPLGARPLSVNNILLTGPVRVAEGCEAFHPLRRGKTGRPEWLSAPHPPARTGGPRRCHRPLARARTSTN